MSQQIEIFIAGSPTQCFVALISRGIFPFTPEGIYTYGSHYRIPVSFEEVIVKWDNETGKTGIPGSLDHWHPVRVEIVKRD